MLDRELIDQFKANLNWVPYSERFLSTTEAPEAVDPRVKKFGTGFCRICGDDFGKLTANSTVCQSAACKVAVNSEYQRKCRTPAYKARQAKARRDRNARRAA